MPRLADFLATLPRRLRVAVEFRHPSWLGDDVYDTLRAHGAALCIAEGGRDDGALTTPLVATTSWGYLRLRKVRYTGAALAVWAERIRAQRWSEAFVYFKHEDTASGPRLAARLSRLLAP